jgi:hypothetical protein
MVFRGVDNRAQELAAVVGWVSLGVGLPLTLAPRRMATFLGWGDRAPLARAIGVADLVVGPVLLLRRDRARWMLVRALLNALLAAIYARVLAAGAPRRGRAVGGFVGMSALTLTDSFLARRLRILESTRPGAGA